MKVRGPFVSMPYSGISTFLKAPLVEEFSRASRESIAVLGVPFDEATTNRPGTRFGPRAIREASLVYAYWKNGEIFDRGHGRKGLFDIETGQTILAEIRLVDAGDVPISPVSLDETYRRITESVSAIIQAGVFPLVLGGDHSITYPVVRGFAGAGENLWVLQLDSHLDTITELDGSEFTHASPMKHLRSLSFVESVFHAGMRGILADEDVLEEVAAVGGTVVTTAEILRDGIDGIVSRMPALRKCYVTIDIDLFDPSIAPGTGVPEPGGLGFRDVNAVLRKVAESYEVVGFDIVEVNPLYDSTGITSLLAARTAIDFLGAICSQKT